MGTPGAAAAGAGAATGCTALAGGGGTPAGGSGGGDAARATAGRGLPDAERDAGRDRACSDWMNGSTSGWSLRANSSKSKPSRGSNCFFLTRRWN